MNTEGEGFRTSATALFDAAVFMGSGLAALPRPGMTP
jgi:hypothetical protein